MRPIQREWLKKIGGYGEVPVLRPGPPGGEPWQEAPPGEEGELGEADGADGAAEDGGQGAQQEAPPLSVPERVERELRERREKDGQGLQNLGLAPQAFALEGHYLRGLATRFARMVSKVAEDSADLPRQGDDEWDLVELRQRRFSGRTIGQCRLTREKRKVAVVLDTSPSCAHQARLFAAIARVGEQLGDCDLYDAPNFAIHSRRVGERWQTLPETEREWNFEKRVVLAFGDFDGIERICAASARRGNRIYWFSCEERPPVMEANRGTLVHDFKGRYFPATNLAGLMKAMRRVR